MRRILNINYINSVIKKTHCSSFRIFTSINVVTLYKITNEQESFKFIYRTFLENVKGQYIFKHFDQILTFSNLDLLDSFLNLLVNNKSQEMFSVNYFSNGKICKINFLPLMGNLKSIVNIKKRFQKEMSKCESFIHDYYFKAISYKKLNQETAVNLFCKLFNTEN